MRIVNHKPSGIIPKLETQSHTLVLKAQATSSFLCAMSGAYVDVGWLPPSGSEQDSDAEGDEDVVPNCSSNAWGYSPGLRI